jgi:ribosomal protein S18 acetylase RimI-like enzyme
MGVGPAILKAGFATLAKANIKRCSVSVQMSNLHARKLYEQHGFIYHRKHGQFLGAKIITLIQYVRYITKMDL